MKAADQALIFDGTGTVKVQEDPSQLTLSNEFVEQLEVSTDDDEKESKSDNEEATKTKENPGEDLQSRARGDASLYKYLFTTASKWEAAIWVLTVGLVVAATGLARKLLRAVLAVCSKTDQTQSYSSEFGSRRTLRIPNILLYMLRWDALVSSSLGLQCGMLAFHNSINDRTKPTARC